ncbi:MAG TPA: choice-of-anchor B family protein [Chloroflexota bacterium]|nr:choice-of-anchor B family protein [Chloroflexota bacterium]
MMQRDPLKRVLFAVVLFILAAFFIVSGQRVQATPDTQTGDTGKPVDGPMTDAMRRFLADQEPPLENVTSTAATPCVGGMADIYPCSNVDLLAHISLAAMSATAGNDSWGWTDPLDGKEYAIMGLNNGTAFVDISDPENPIYLGKLPTQTSNSTWRDIKVYADHAFVVSEASGHGMQVFDLTLLRNVVNPPVTFSNTAHYSQFGNAHNIAINEDSGYAYAVGTGTCSGGLHMVNIQNPTSSTNAGCFSADGYTHDTQCVIYNGPDVEHQGDEICFAFNEDTVTIVDVTNKAAPVQLSRTPYAGSAYTHQGWLTPDHRYILHDDELDEQSSGHNTRTYVWDASNLEAPLLIGNYTAAVAAIDHNLYIKGNYAFEANYRSGLRILDITDVGTPASINEVAYFDTYPTNDNASFNGAWSTYPYFDSGVVIISDIERGLFIVRPILASFGLSAAPSNLSICQGEDALYTVTVTEAGSTAPVTLTAVDVPAGANHDFSVNPVIPTGTSDFSVTNTAAVSPGSYAIGVVGSNVTDTLTTTVNLVVSQGIPGVPVLTAPANGATDIPNTPTFMWNSVSGATSYHLELADDINFSNIIYTANVPGTSHALPGANALAYNTWHYWRVTASNPCGSGDTSAQFSFRTVGQPNVFCATPNLSIPDNNPTGASHTINIPTSANILDVDIYINATHTWVGDLRFVVNHNATNATIIDRPGVPASTFGCSGDNYDVTINDEGPDGNIETQCAASAPAIFGDRVGGDPPNTSLLAAYDGMDIGGDWTITVSDLAGGDTGTLVEWCVVPTLEAAGGGVDLSPDQDASGAPGSVVVYSLTITNTGSVSDTFDLAVDAQWPTELSASSISLDAGAVGSFTASVTVPSNAAAGEQGLSLVTAVSQSDPSVSDDSFLTTTATELRGVALSADPDALSGELGAVVTYTVHITNTGNTTDTFSLSTGDDNGWMSHVQPVTVTLAAGANDMVMVMVHVDMAATDGEMNVTTVTAVSANDANITAEVELTTTATVTPPEPGYFIYLPIILKP